MPSPTTSPRPWTPTHRDRTIYHWIKFDGETQLDVAQRFKIHQSTVSRIVERYEHWLAHGGPEQEGALTHEERRRVQRRLTYERNEWVINTAMRLTNKLQELHETTARTFAGPNAHTTPDREVSTKTHLVDRTGIAARFLRLVHRVNMDQHRLQSEDDLPPLPILTHDDIAEYNATALAAEQAADASDILDASLDPLPPPANYKARLAADQPIADDDDDPADEAPQDSTPATSPPPFSHREKVAESSRPDEGFLPSASPTSSPAPSSVHTTHHGTDDPIAANQNRDYPYVSATPTDAPEKKSKSAYTFAHSQALNGNWGQNKNRRRP